MKKLAPREEQIMQILWRRGPSFVKEIVNELPDPKPHYNSVSTMVRTLQDKGFIGHNTFGTSHQYYAILQKEDYQNKAVKDLLSSFFNDSVTDIVTYFANKEEISEDELQNIIKLIKSKKA